MDRNSAVAEIRDGLGFNTRLEEVVIINALKEAQRELEQAPELPWFLQVFETPLVTVANIETVTLPTNFLRDLDQGSLWVVNDSGYPRRNEVLKSPFYQDTDLNRDGTDAGRPLYYRLEIVDIRLYPTPDKVYNLRFNYYKSDTVLDTNTENLWLKHAPGVLLGFAGQIVAGKTKDAKSYQFFSDLRTRGEAALQNQSVARRESGVQYQMGGPH